MILEIRIRSELEMIELGRWIGERLNTGDLLFLSGDLGAGKTTLTKGIAKGLTIEEEITSPTFQIIKSYQGRILLNHLDLYRLKNQSELDMLEPEILTDTGVVVVEWGDLWNKQLDPHYLEIKIEYSNGNGLTDRIVKFYPYGIRYESLIEGMNRC
jgi:tRNA threonylcarbamoyladenosine biosynthesis protein TsaE